MASCNYVFLLNLNQLFRFEKYDFHIFLVVSSFLMILTFFMRKGDCKAVCGLKFDIAGIGLLSTPRGGK